MATKGIPYGLSDYARLATQNYYYVDKTMFIPMIEKAASFFFLIRPRRFGKSLMISV
ncbi:MAG: AAA family ATPase, partial [Tannerellaceae bacterium]